MIGFGCKALYARFARNFFLVFLRTWSGSSSYYETLKVDSIIVNLGKMKFNSHI